MHKLGISILPLTLDNFLPKSFDASKLPSWQKISPTNCVGRMVKVSYANSQQFKILKYIARNGKGDVVEVIDFDHRSHSFLASECKFITPFTIRLGPILGVFLPISAYNQ